MRYQVGHPLEEGRNVSVFSLHDKLCPNSQKVFTLIREPTNQKELVALARAIDFRKSIQHPCLPEILDLAFRGRNPGVISNCIDLPTLDSLTGGIPWNKTVEIAATLSDILDQLHKKNLCIGYLSPRKIFIDFEGRPVLNFLLNRQNLISEASDYSRRYASREYLESGKVSPAGDNYSLGIVLFELLSGRYPFHYTSEQDLVSRKKSVLPSFPGYASGRISQEARISLELLLHPDPKMRIEAGRIAQALEPHCQHLETAPLPLANEIVEREKEIAQFITILENREQSKEIVLLSGSRGTGKTRLAGFVRLCALLKRFRTETHDEDSSSFPISTGDKREIVDQCIFMDRPGTAELEKSIKSNSSKTGRLIWVIETERPAEISDFAISYQNSDCEARVTRIHLQSLSSRNTDRLFPFTTSPGSDGGFLADIGSLSDGRPGTVSDILDNFVSRGTLIWTGGQWSCGNLSTPEKDVQALLERKREDLFAGLAPQQEAILKTLAIHDQPIPLNLLSRTSEIPQETLDEHTRGLVEAGCVHIRITNGHPSVELKLPLLADVIRRGLSRRQCSRINRSLGMILESRFEQTKDLSLLYPMCLNLLHAGLSFKASRHLNSAIDYLTRNSSYHEALRLFEAALYTNRFSLSIPANWITYLKLLLKTGREMKCRDFLKRKPGFELNNIILFRIGHALDSLDLDADEICPHLAVNIREIFPPSSLSRTIGAPLGRKVSTERNTHVLKLGSDTFTRSSSHETSRFCHQLSLLYRERGKIEQAIRFELKAFRIDLSLNKKVPASRKLINLCEMLIEKGRMKQASSWLHYCISMAEDTGDLKTVLLAQVLLAEINRAKGRILEAEISVSWVREQNNLHCGSRRILAATLLQEARNLFSRNRPIPALQKISELTSAEKCRHHKYIRKEAIYLEASALAEIGEHGMAISALETASRLQGPGTGFPPLKAIVLQAEIHFKSGNTLLASNLIKTILRNKHFLPLESLVRTRILMAKLWLTWNDLPRAEKYINHARILSRDLDRSHLQAEALLIKGDCLAKRGEYKAASLMYFRSALSASRTDSPALELSGRQGFRQTSKTKPRPDSPDLHREMTQFTEMLGKTGNSTDIEQVLLQQVRGGFPSGLPCFCCKRNQEEAVPPGTELRTSPESLFSRTGDFFAATDKSATAAIGATITFPVGRTTENRLLEATLPPGFFLRQDEYDFIKHLSALTSILQSEHDCRMQPITERSKTALILRDGREIVGRSKAMRQIMEKLLSIADLKTTVLLQGESGTGKELIAWALHDFSVRKKGPFIAVNCASFPPDLVENELFGHVRGSYTGADSAREGLFEAASGGTIFLDEISTLSPQLQPRLLRVIENKTVRPLGATTERYVDTRIVAASNQDLEKLVRDGVFREDLFYRLDALRIEIPPLRKRKEDIRHICFHFLRHITSEDRKEISEEALERLTRYNYPGNVRELLNIMENLVCFSASKTIQSYDIDKCISFRYPDQPPAGRQSKVESIIFSLARGEIDFWEGVRTPFIEREINRAEVKEIVSGGLKECEGSYKKLLNFFNLPSNQYKKLLIAFIKYFPLIL